MTVRHPRALTIIEIGGEKKIVPINAEAAYAERLREPNSFRARLHFMPGDPKRRPYKVSHRKHDDGTITYFFALIGAREVDDGHPSIGESLDHVAHKIALTRVKETLLRVRFGGTEPMTSKARFHMASMEFPVGERRLDVAVAIEAENPDVQALFLSPLVAIEVCVFHRCAPERTAELARASITTLEWSPVITQELPEDASLIETDAFIDRIAKEIEEDGLTVELLQAPNRSEQENEELKARLKSLGEHHSRIKSYMDEHDRRLREEAAWDQEAQRQHIRQLERELMGLRDKLHELESENFTAYLKRTIDRITR